jgi:hypothetical protein
MYEQHLVFANKWDGIRLTNTVVQEEELPNASWFSDIENGKRGDILGASTHDNLKRNNVIFTYIPCSILILSKVFIY